MINYIKKFIFYIFWIISRIFNYPNYLLEKNIVNKYPIFNKDIEDYIVFKLIKKFIDINKIFNSGLIVSLSGGVDSMVVLHCLMYIKNFYYPKMNLGCVCVNYNMRFESNDEMRFLEEYLEEYFEKKNLSNLINDFNIIKVNNTTRKDVFGTGGGKRSEFEIESKNIRYRGYNEMINRSNYEGVILGHHKDDLIENIFTNIMYGRNILDLTVMKEISVKNGIKFMRPLLPIHKNKIYQVAHDFNIPYFKDTTPNWSKRGIMRKQIFPLMDRTFDNFNDKLFNIGMMSDKLSDLIDDKIISEYKKNFEIIDCGIIANYNEFINNKSVNDIILPRLVHDLGFSYFGKKKLYNIYSMKGNEYISIINKNFIVYKNNSKIFILKRNLENKKYEYLNTINISNNIKKKLIINLDAV